MFNPFYFSNYVRPSIAKIKFILIVLTSFFRVLFRRNKQPEQQILEYSEKYQFEQSLLVIRYGFRNALWYHFKGIKRTVKGGVIVLNLRKVPKMPIVLVVYGFFRKMTFLIDITSEATMNTNTFRTKINKPRDVKYYTRSIALCAEHTFPAIPKVIVKHSRINLHSAPITMKNTNIHFEYPSFNQTEFL